MDFTVGLLLMIEREMNIAIGVYVLIQDKENNISNSHVSNYRFIISIKSWYNLYISQKQG